MSAGLDWYSQRLYAMPFVTFLNFSGVFSYSSWNTDSLIISEWSLDTPFTLCEAATQRVAMCIMLSLIMDIRVVFALSPPLRSMRDWQ